MARTSELSEGQDITTRRRFPWAFAAIVLMVLVAIGYGIDSDRSLSERQGVVTQVDAENDVIPSLAPDQN
jgi:hypothetical protein